MPSKLLTAHQVEQVLALAAAAAAHDGVDPLNEEARFALRDGSAEHFGHYRRGELAGYLIRQPHHRTAQLVVAPAHRRSGIGTDLLGRLRAWSASVPARSGDGPDGLWAFGYLPAAQGFASAHGLVPVRGLLVMSRELDDPLPTTVPDGLTLRPFRPDDAPDLLAVNALAFAHHPEQGSLDAAGLAARIGEGWFDPSGLILGHDAAGPAGFHWTKRVDAATGEVYVLAVAPRAQGRGYGRALLNAGLAHLRANGMRRVLLYVDMADEVAVRMYESAGFRVANRDLLLAPTPQEKP
ncbi:MAG: mycothiol synthase [Propionicimonas sp.]